MNGGARSTRALLLAPKGRDAAVAKRLLEQDGVPAQACSSVGELLQEIDKGAGVAVVVEEALLDVDLRPLKQWMSEQPSWSDFAFIVLTLRTAAARGPFTTVLDETLGNVSYIERPFHPSSLTSLVRSALRGRKRQYDARERLEELHSGQERLRFAQEAGHIGTFEIEAETRDILVSPSFCRIWGLPVQDKVPLGDLVSVMVEEDRSKIRTTDALLTRDALDYTEYRILRPDTGELRWIARQGGPVFEPTTGATRFFGVCYDITERRRAEEALRESETRFRLIADSAPVPMWVTRLDRKREFVNQAYADFIGVAYDEALDYDWRLIIHPEDVGRIYREQVEKENALEPFTLEARFRNAQGEWRWLRTASQPRWDIAGQHSGFIGVAHDITAAVEARERLRSLADTLEREVDQRTAQLRIQEAQLRTMFETSYQLQGLLSVDGMLLEANRRTLDAMSAPLEDVRERPFWQTPFLLGTPVVAERVRDAISVVANGGTYREEVLLNLPTGPRAFDLVLRNMSGPDGTAAAIFFEALELTERRAAEEQLRQAQKMESLGQLTGGIAHDFNNLLTGITGSLDLIRRRIAANRTDGLDRFMDAASTSAQRAASLTHRLLAFARRQSLDTKATDANALVKGLEDLLRRTLGEKLHLHTALADDLWPVLTDANQLESALVNLAINARDAMADGGRLTISTKNVIVGSWNKESETDALPGEYVALRVVDTGTGMPPEVIAKVFDPFFTTKPLGQGTGLGLSMVYGFVKQSGGFVRIDSSPGKGTAITLHLPRADALQEPDAPVLRAVPRGQGETVLVVEDDASVRLLMTEVLDELGYRYMQAPDGAQAVPILQSSMPIDLLVTDVGLPHLDGRQLADIARQTRPDLKILFVTGYAEKATSRGGFLGPGMEMITKPFALDDLGTRIRELIGS